MFLRLRQLAWRAAAPARAAFERHPLVTNCISYGVICGVAEATQQLIDRRRHPLEVS